MSPHLPLQPVFDESETSTGVAYGKVVHPTAHNRIDELDYPIDRLRDEASEDVLELAQQCDALLELGWIIRPPLALQASHAAELKTQEAEAFSLCQVDLPTLFLVDIDLEFGQFLAETLIHRFKQPVMLRIRIHQNHKIIGKPCVLQVSVGPPTGGLLSPFQHPVNLIQVQVAEHGREHPTLGKALRTGCFDQQFQQLHDLRVIDPRRDFLEQVSR